MPDIAHGTRHKEDQRRRRRRQIRATYAEISQKLDESAEKPQKPNPKTKPKPKPKPKPIDVAIVIHILAHSFTTYESSVVGDRLGCSSVAQRKSKRMPVHHCHHHLHHHHHHEH